jgi:hypothetical protein
MRGTNIERRNGVWMQPFLLDSNSEKGISSLLQESIADSGIAILPPMDVVDSLRLMDRLGVKGAATLVDPWYNKGVGGVRDDYDDFINTILALAGRLSEHVYLWGFPEIVARFIDNLPTDLELTAWLTWYYKNNPSVIRGWRSSQMACLHLSKPGAKLYPEHFLNEAQLEKQAQGKLRYMPGPPSVIEDSLLVGFVGRKEQTGHPAQKPIGVFDKLIRMVSEEGDLILDPMCGSGTTGAATKVLGRTTVLCDSSEEYIQITEKRLNVERIALPSELPLAGIKPNLNP